jgi:hypothetical protein
MMLLQLVLLLGTAVSFPTLPSDGVRAWYGENDVNHLDARSSGMGEELVALVQAQLPQEIHFSMFRNETQPQTTDMSFFAQASAKAGIGAGCVLPPPLPPNTDDCGFIMDSMKGVSTYTPPPRNSCFRYQYRSCFLFNCAGPCQAEGFQLGEWYYGLVQVMNDCVVGLGKGGFFVSEGEHGEARGKSAGILHMGVLDYTLYPVFDLCANETFG